MSRARAGKVSKNRHQKILKLAKGYRGRANSCFRVAIEKVEKALSYAYRDRRNRKRDLRSLWIARINAAVRQHNMVYSDFIGKLSKINIGINRKMIAELSVNNPAAFANIIDQVKAYNDN